jgi:hypothetical protein
MVFSAFVVLNNPIFQYLFNKIFYLIISQFFSNPYGYMFPALLFSAASFISIAELAPWP